MNRRSFLQATSLSILSQQLLSRNTMAATPNILAMPNYSNLGTKLLTKSTPAQDRFSLPAEWAPHDFCIMALPPPKNWSELGITRRDLHRQWAAIANELNEYEPVVMVVRPEDKLAAKAILSKTIELFEQPLNDGWSRDSGPVFVTNGRGQRRVAGFTFNGWGAKFPPYDDDALLKARLCADLKTSMYPIDLVLEGGAVTQDGEGTLITTEQCLLHKTRSSRSKAEIEVQLNQSLGTSKVIWLGKGLAPDPVTDGHVDGIAAFVAPGKVLLHTTTDRSDVNYKICQDAKRRLEQATDAKGRQLEVFELPLGDEVSHMNFYIGNDCVLVPIAGYEKQDDIALGILEDLFPKRDVVGIDSAILAAGGGGIHCITQQVPKV